MNESGAGQELQGDALTLWTMMHELWGGRDSNAMPHRWDRGKFHASIRGIQGIDPRPPPPLA